MIRISVKDNFPQVQHALDQLHKDVAGPALVSAVNRILTQAKTAMGREIRDEFNIPAAKITAALRVNRATFRNGVLSVEGSLESPTKRGRSLNLINFAARQTAKGVTIKVKKAGPRKLIPHAFIANQGRTVFQRVGKARLPIKALQTIDVAQMFNTRRINKKIVDLIEVKFPAIFEHEAGFYLRRFNGGRG